MLYSRNEYEIPKQCYYPTRVATNDSYETFQTNNTYYGKKIKDNMHNSYFLTFIKTYEG